MPSRLDIAIRALRSVLKYVKSPEVIQPTSYAERALIAGPKVLDIMAMPREELLRVKDIRLPIPQGVGGEFHPKKKLMYITGGSPRSILSHEFAHARQTTPGEDPLEKQLARAMVKYYNKAFYIVPTESFEQQLPLEIHAKLMEGIPVSDPMWRREYLRKLLEAVKITEREATRHEALKEVFRKHFGRLDWNID
jgi:hypothetical protein